VKQENRVSRARADSRGELLGPTGGTVYDECPGGGRELARGIPAATIGHDDLDTGRACTVDGFDDPIRFVQGWDHHGEPHRPTIATPV
jgi:hypothetical protein